MGVLVVKTKLAQNVRRINRMEIKEIIKTWQTRRYRGELTLLEYHRFRLEYKKNKKRAEDWKKYVRKLNKR